MLKVQNLSMVLKDSITNEIEDKYNDIILAEIELENYKEKSGYGVSAIYKGKENTRFYR